MSVLLKEYYPFANDPLPVGWIEVPAGAVTTDIRSGFSSGKHNTAGVGIPHLRPMNVTPDGNVILQDVLYVSPSSGNLRLSDGDLLFTNTSSTVWVGKTGLVKNSADWAFSNHMTRLRLKEGMVENFFAKQLHYLCRAGFFAHHCTKHVNQSSIAPSLLRNCVPVRVPPLAEQRRIMARIEAAESTSLQTRAHLDELAQKLAQTRQSLLTDALSGIFTSDWREKQTDASKWRQSTVGECLESLKYGTAKKCSQTPNGTPVLRIPNVVGGTISVQDLKYGMLEEKEIKSLALKKGDILMVRSNGSPSLLGAVAQATGQVEGFAYAGYLLRLRPIKGIYGKYLLHALRSPAVRQIIEANARSSAGVNNINAAEVRALPLSVPPLREQHEIVRRLDSALARVSAAAIACTDAGRSLNQFDQAVLARAFRGRLVEQDPNDESAEALLAHLAVDVDREPHKPKKRMPRKAKSSITREVRSILDVLRAAKKGVSPEDLFHASGRDEADLEQVEDFYSELRGLVKTRRVKDKRPDAATVILIAQPGNSTTSRSIRSRTFAISNSILTRTMLGSLPCFSAVTAAERAISSRPSLSSSETFISVKKAILAMSYATPCRREGTT